MFGFFRFLKELFNGTYFTHDSHGNKLTEDYNPTNGASAWSFPDGSTDHPIGALFNRRNWQNVASDTKSGADSVVSSLTGVSGIGDLIKSLTNRITANELTGAEREQNTFNAEQAQIDRAWQEQMSNTAYQRSVADMRSAGVNPALAMNNGGASTPSGAMASGSGAGLGASMSELMSLFMMKPQIRLMEKQGDAALINAQANKESASAQTKNADTRVFESETARMLANNAIRLGDNTIEFTQKQMESISQQIKESESRIELQDIERACKEFHLQYDKDTAETNKALLIQQIAYRAVEMSHLQQLDKESLQKISLMSAEEAGIAWQKEHPKLANIVGASGAITGVIGNVVKGSASAVLGRWSK